MSQIAKGGRGKKVPYETVHCRIPKPLLPLVRTLAEMYRELVLKCDDSLEEAAERISFMFGLVATKPGNKNSQHQGKKLSLEVAQLKRHNQQLQDELLESQRKVCALQQSLLASQKECAVLMQELEAQFTK